MCLAPVSVCNDVLKDWLPTRSALCIVCGAHCDCLNCALTWNYSMGVVSFSSAV